MDSETKGLLTRWVGRAAIAALVIIGLVLMRPTREAPAAPDLRSDSLAAQYLRAVRSQKPPELLKRTADRRRVQRIGYILTLDGVMRQHALDALLPYLRMRLHLEFWLPQDQLVAYIPIIQPERRDLGFPEFFTYGSKSAAIPLYEDRTFPADPWAAPGDSLMVK
ncbi:MAG: hypothetical protein AB1428_04740 [Bacteroidota bacterium]